ncbi:hypothetical protein NBRC116602_28880 [Hyphomicrobiales bacterium 4NK60-0047b]
MLNEFSYPDFFQVRNHQCVFHKILYDAIRERKGVHLSFEPAKVIVSIDKKNRVKNNITLKGGWRSSLLNIQHQKSSSLLLSPFFFNIKEFYLSHSCIFTMDMEHRSIADIFMRNLFYAACRKGCITFESIDEQKDDQMNKNHKDFTLRYLWIFEEQIAEKLFPNKNVLDMMVVNAHFQIKKFSNPIIENGFNEFRANASNLEQNSYYKKLINEIIDVREKVLSHI